MIKMSVDKRLLVVRVKVCISCVWVACAAAVCEAHGLASIALHDIVKWIGVLVRLGQLHGGF